MLFSIYKSFTTPNANYFDFIYNQLHNAHFYNNLEKFQCNAALAITATTIKGTSTVKIYEELDLKLLKFRK